MSSRKRMVHDLCDSAQAGRTREVAKLLRRDPTIINEASSTGQVDRMTALHFAARHGHLDIVRYCMGRGGGVHERSWQAAGVHGDSGVGPVLFPDPSGIRPSCREGGFA